MRTQADTAAAAVVTHWSFMLRSHTPGLWLRITITLDHSVIFNVRRNLDLDTHAFLLLALGKTAAKARIEQAFDSPRRVKSQNDRF